MFWNDCRFSRANATLSLACSTSTNALHIQHQRARGIQKLQLRHFAGGLRHLDAPLALAAALDQEIRPEIVFSGTARVIGVEMI